MSRIVRATETVATLFLIAMLVSVTVQILARLFGIDAIWTDEVARLCLIWMIYLGSAALVFWQGHIRIEIILAHVGGWPHRLLRLLIAAVVLASVVAVFWLSLQLIQRPTIQNQRTPMIGLPILYIYAAAPISLGLMAGFFLATLRAQIFGELFRKPPS